MKTNLLVLFLFLLITNSNKIEAQTIGADIATSYIICSDGSVKAWGSNISGGFGNGNTVSSYLPISVPNFANARSIHAGGWTFENFVLKEDSTLWFFDTVMKQVTTISKVVDVKVSDGRVLILKSDGTVWGMGNNVQGQLGDGTTINRSIPVQVLNLTNIKRIATGGYHSLALRSDGTVWSWGSNQYPAMSWLSGQLGINSTIAQSNIPVQVLNVSNVIDIEAGFLSSFFLKSDGTVLVAGTQQSSFTQILSPIATSINNVKGIYSTHMSTFFIKTDSTVWAYGYNYYGQLGMGNTVDLSSPTQIPGLEKIITVSAGYTHTLALESNGTVWAWGNNGSGQLGDGTNINRYSPVPVQNLCVPMMPNILHHTHGITYVDDNSNCTNNLTEIKLPTIPIQATPGNYFSITNTSGSFTLDVLDSMNLSITPIIPVRLQHMISNPCPLEYNVLLGITDPIDTAGFDFGFDGDLCHQLRVDVGATRRRRCFRNTTNVFYINEGLIAANNVQVVVNFDQYDIPVGSSHVYTFDSTTNTMIFNLGTVNAGQSGFIIIYDSVACVNGITNLTLCTEAWITPTNQCLIDATTGPSWDNSSTSVDGECQLDSIRFVIYNHGSGDMLVPAEYRIYADNILMQTGTYQLLSGDSLVIYVVSGGATIRLEADQHSDHPGHSHPRVTIEACGTNMSGSFSVNMFNQAPLDDEDVHVEMECLQIRDSYDPNFKENSPLGIGTKHITHPDNLIEYTIHFQNTGSDTAYVVEVIDTLSNYFDLSTFEPGVSSHPYSLSIEGNGKPVLRFMFDDIDLVDSMTNENSSHGFVKFKIKANNAPLGTRIDNLANIYFDYNYPIVTDTAFFTLDTMEFSTADFADVLQDPDTLQYFCLGGDLIITPVFSGYDLSFQWYKNSQPLIGSNSNLLILNNFNPSDTGSYYCIVTNEFNIDTTNTVKVLIADETVILNTLNDNFVCEGSVVTIDILADGDNLNYQWYLNNNLIPNENNSDLVFDTANISNNGLYYCLVTGSCGADTSNIVSISVFDFAVPNINSSIDTLFCDGVYSQYQWYFNGNIMPGEILNYLIVSQNGNYSVSVIDSNSCYGESNTINFNSVGMKEDLIESTSVKCYPNPAHKVMFIETDIETKINSIQIVSIQGQIVWRNSVNISNKEEIDISFLPNGIYIIECRTNNGNQLVKFVKQ